jgi:hypothetical protein
MSRFDTSKGPWYPLDRVAIVNRAEDLLKTGRPLLLAPLDLAADGSARAAPMSMAWTGFGGAILRAEFFRLDDSLPDSRPLLSLRGFATDESLSSARTLMATGHVR